MRRTPTGKRLAITPRDLAMFRALQRYRYLRSTYLHAFVGGTSETRFKERLGDLFHEGYLDRPAKQWEFANARHQPAVYELSERARRVLADSGVTADKALTFLSASAHRQFAHALAICEILASVELATLETPYLRFIPWTEILTRAPADTRASAMPYRIPVSTGAVVPDGLFGIEYLRDERKAYRFFALEIDRGTMPVVRTDSSKTSFLAKVGAYQEIIDRQLHKILWGVPNLFLLTVTTTPERLTNMLRNISDIGAAPLFLFRSATPASLATPCREMLREPWLRAGLSPFGIDC